jgi:hypothetical protein
VDGEREHDNLAGKSRLQVKRNIEAPKLPLTRNPLTSKQMH